MQNVKKVELENNNNHKRNRRRRKNMIGYYILVVFLAISIAFSLSITLIFNVKAVIVNGVNESVYNEDKVAEESGILKGDNLVRMNTEKIKSQLMDRLLYIDDVTVKKTFPDKVTIDITPSVDQAYVECQGGYMLISEGWRILEHSVNHEKENLIVVYGFEPESNEEKTIMKSVDADKDAALKEILGEIKKLGITGIVSVDISDKYDVILNYDNRIKIKIEKAQDVEYKLRYANKIITEELRENKSGYLIYRNSLGYSYVSEEEYERINGSISSGITVSKDNDIIDSDISEDEMTVTESDSEIQDVSDDPVISSEITFQAAGW